ncbi:MAG TPA: hypothetical protein PLO65_12155, partial [Caulobacter sp.]|nr:hypothetical protein [Caulobacter sp.]
QGQALRACRSATRSALEQPVPSGDDLAVRLRAGWAMTDGSDQETSLEHRAARRLNVTMVALLALAGTVIGLWVFLSELPAIRGIFDALPARQQETLFRAGFGLLITMAGLTHLLPIVGKVFNRGD